MQMLGVIIDGSRFQFLIGTIKTKRNCNGNGRSMKFQFLIGTIKTAMQKWDRVADMYEVSIPHRYDQNLRRFSPSKVRSIVSIPHRYDQNGGAAGWRHYTYRFQFLIGTIKTRRGS